MGCKLSEYLEAHYVLTVQEAINPLAPEFPFKF